MDGNKNTRRRQIYKNNKKTKKHLVYSKEDYNSGDGMLTSVWGPSMWHFLHTMSFNYPVNPTKEDKKCYKDFILSLRNVLPCKYCRINLKNNLKKVPITAENMKNRENFSKYVYHLHETINRMLNKKSNLTYEEVRERYEHFRSRCTEEKPKVFTFLTEQKQRQQEEQQQGKTRKNRVKEKGCTEPLYGKKSKCIIKIVPQEEKGSTFQMDEKCVKSRVGGYTSTT